MKIIRIKNTIFNYSEFISATYFKENEKWKIKVCLKNELDITLKYRTKEEAESDLQRLTRDLSYNL